MDGQRSKSASVATRSSTGRPPKAIDIVQIDMATGYLKSRAFAAALVLLSGAVLAIAWDWIGGWLIAGASLIVLVDAAGRLRLGTRDRIVAPLLLDVTAAGAAVLLSDISHVVLVAPFFYNLVSAAFALPRRLSSVTTTYVAVWSVVVITTEYPIAGTALTPERQDIAIVLAIFIYLAATYLMTTTASVAIRERQRLHEELREQESRLQAVVDGTPIVLYAIDTEGRFTLSEGPGLDLLGLKPGQVVGLDIADVYGDVPEFLDMVDAAMASDDDTQHEVQVGGVHFAVRHRPQFDQNGIRTGIVGVAVDVSAEATYRRELEEQIRSKDEFVASVSHELRTPLSVVFGLSEVLTDEATVLSSDEENELQSLLSQQAGEVVAIVEDLLVAARADIDRLVVVKEAVDIGAQVSSVLQPLTWDQDVAIAAPVEQVVALCDATRIRQILRNLLMNATRHGGENIRLSYDRTGDRVVIEVCDDGQGVPAAQEARIFDAYHRSDADSGNPASIGLGLTVAKTLARLMDGDIVYERRDGWSVFSLTLPAMESVTAG